MDEIFGAENFVAQIIWQKVYSPRMDDKGISAEHDYILAYAGSDDFIPAKMPFVQNAKQFTEIDSTLEKIFVLDHSEKKERVQVEQIVLIFFIPFLRQIRQRYIQFVLMVQKGDGVYNLIPTKKCWQQGKSSGLRSKGNGNHL